MLHWSMMSNSQWTPLNPQEVQVQSGAGCLNVDQDVVQELTDLFSSLFKTPKVAEMTKQVSSICPLAEPWKCPMRP